MRQLLLDLIILNDADAPLGVVNELEIHYTPRMLHPRGPIETPQEAVGFLKPFLARRRDQEKLWVIPLDTRLRPKGVYLASLGTMTATLAHPREIYRIAVATSAASILIAHNHPSGDPSPSSADVAITRKIRQAGEVLEIRLHDHVVVGEAGMDPQGLGYYSFREGGHL